MEPAEGRVTRIAKVLGISWLRGALLFVGVVWSIAGAFLVLEAGLQSLASGLRGSFAIGSEAQTGSEHCRRFVKTLTPPVPGQSTDRGMAHAAWLLGLQLGYAEGWYATGKVARDAAQRSIEGSRPISSTLSIPPLVLPVERHEVTRLPDFATFVASDPPCIAASLEYRFSGRHAALYRLGAVVGFAAIFRTAPEFRDVLQPEIRIYGTAAGIPPDLLRAVSERLGDWEARKAEVNRIDAYLRNGY